jgi:hypothetical protein
MLKLKIEGKMLLTQILTPSKARNARYLLIKSLRNAACVIDAVAAKARAQCGSRSVTYLARLERAPLPGLGTFYTRRRSAAIKSVISRVLANR